MARILSVSYDELLLDTRASILEKQGYEVVSAHGLIDSLQYCEDGRFDLFILGHSIPERDKNLLVEAFKSHCAAPIISLLRNNDDHVKGADLNIEPEPRKLLQAVADVLRNSEDQSTSSSSSK